MDIPLYRLALILLAVPPRFGRRCVRAQSEIPAGLVIDAMLGHGLIVDLGDGLFGKVPAKMPRLEAWAPEAWVIRADANDWRRKACIDLVSKTFVQTELDTVRAVEECFGIIGVTREDEVLGCVMLAAAGDIISLQGFDLTQLGARDVPSTALVNLAVQESERRRGLATALIEWAWHVTMAMNGQRMYAGSDTVGGQAALLAAGMVQTGQLDTGDGWEHAHLDGSPLRCITTRLYTYDKNDGAPAPVWER